MKKEIKNKTLRLHKKNRGKIETKVKTPLKTSNDLSLAYTPGVAFISEEIHKDKNKVFDYTNRGNLVAIVTDGSSVLGLGNIGPEAAYPVIEGKAIIFKEFAGIDAFPICLNTQDTEEIVETVKRLEPTFAGINLEDISAPRCFEIERRLIKEMNIPVFHDDQHGTAIVILAGLINALKIVKKDKQEVKVVINGAGAAGIATTKILLKYGFKHIIILDSQGIIYNGRSNLNWIKKEIAKTTNRNKLKGGLKEALAEADIFIGVSQPNLVTKQMIKSMNKNSIIFAMANPVPEIMPKDALKAGAKIVATGRSDFPNQVNNALAFPGIFRGVLDYKIKKINDCVVISAAEAIASIIKPSELKPEYIIPKLFNPKIVKAIAKTMKNCM